MTTILAWRRTAPLRNAYWVRFANSIAWCPSAGTPCRSPAVRGKKRCRMHGGAKGSGAPRGNQNALKHGLYTREAIEERRALRQLIRARNGCSRKSVKAPFPVPVRIWCTPGPPTPSLVSMKIPAVSSRSAECRPRSLTSSADRHGDELLLVSQWAYLPCTHRILFEPLRDVVGHRAASFQLVDVVDCEIVPHVAGDEVDRHAA